MNKSILIIAVIVLSISFLTGCRKSKTTPLSDYKVEVIHEDWNKTLQTAQQSDKNIFLMLHADWCSVCKNFIADIMTNEEVSQAVKGKIIMSLIDGDKDYGKTYCTQYGCNGFPTFVITDKNGTLLAKRTGSLSKDDFLSWLSPHYK